MGKVAVSVNLPEWLHSALRRTKRALSPQKNGFIIDLSGDREVEYSFIASRLPVGPGHLLDFGCGFGTLSMHALQRGWNVTGIDLLAYPIRWKHHNFSFIRADFLELSVEPASFDVVLNCSAVEHVGLPGRYDVNAPEQDDDLRAMRKMRELLKPGGLMLMTIPAGHDAVIAPFHRVYGEQRLPRLLEGFQINEQCYWVKDKENCWVLSTRDTALQCVATGGWTEVSHCSYALACLVLSKPMQES